MSGNTMQTTHRLNGKPITECSLRDLESEYRLGVAIVSSWQRYDDMLRLDAIKREIGTRPTEMRRGLWHAWLGKWL